MLTQRVLVVLTGLNVVLLAGLLVGGRSSGAQDGAPVLRGRAIEIVDAQGRVRASLSVLPADPAASHAETVILRLIDPHGRPAVKIAASEQGAGLSFTGHTTSRDTYVVLKAEGTTSSLKLRGEDGRERLITP